MDSASDVVFVVFERVEDAFSDLKVGSKVENGFDLVFLDDFLLNLEFF